MTRGALKGALPGAAAGFMATGGPIGTSIGAGLGAYAGAKVAKFWKGRYISPEEQKRIDEEQARIKSLIPKWFTDEMDRINKSIKLANEKIKVLNKKEPMFINMVLPDIDTDIYDLPNNSNEIAISEFDGNNPDDIYSAVLLTKITFKIDKTSGKITAQKQEGIRDTLRNIPINSPSDIRKLIKFLPLDISYFEHMFGNGWEDELEWEGTNIKNISKYITQFNKIIKSI